VPYNEIRQKQEPQKGDWIMVATIRKDS